MNSPAEQRAAFDQFSRGERELYCIGSATEAKNLDTLTFRKMADNKRQIAAWIRYEEAECWRKENKLESSKVVSLSYAELHSYLMSMPAEFRGCYSLEVI